MPSKRERRIGRVPRAKVREDVTQTKKRDVLIARAEKIYVDEHSRLWSKAQEMIESWIEQNGKPMNDASIGPLLKRLSRLFNEPKGMKQIFGQLGMGLDQDVVGILARAVPRIDRKKLAPRPAAIEEFADRNANLITFVGKETIESVKKQMTGDVSGLHVEALRKRFEEAHDISSRRAELWARDQTLKLHGQLTEVRSKEVGIERYLWTTSSDSRVRVIHAELGERSDNGEAFRYDDPPIISVDGKRGNPGFDFQCRCTAFPVLD